MTVARFFSVGDAILYALPVLWIALVYTYWTEIADAQKENTQSDSVGGSMNLTPWCIFKLAYQGAAPDRERSLISTIALFYDEYTHTPI